MHLIVEGISDPRPGCRWPCRRSASSRICPTRRLPWPGRWARTGNTPSPRRWTSGAATRGWPSCRACRSPRTSPGAAPRQRAVERRILLSAGLRPGDRLLWVHNTHLNYRLTHGRQREDQVLAIDDGVAARPDSEPQVVLGDFNARPESDEIRWLCGAHHPGGRRAFFQDAWAAGTPATPGWTWAAANPYTARLGFLQTDRRLDYIFVTPERRDGRGGSMTAGLCSTSRRPTGCTRPITTGCWPTSRWRQRDRRAAA